MPRLVEALPKYRKHKASGQAVVTLSGRDQYLGPHGTKASKALYDRLIAEWLQQGRQPAPRRRKRLPSPSFALAICASPRATA